jgi:hypothetical protein
VVITLLAAAGRRTPGMTMRRLLALAAALVAAAATPARAERRYILIPGAQAAPAPRDVPSRLILDAGLGPAYLRSSATMNGITQAVSGFGPEVTLAAGWVTTPDLLLGVEYAGIWVYQPLLETKARSNDGAGLVLASHALGPTVRWYFGPDLWVSATPALTALKLSDNDANGFGWEWGWGVRTGLGTVWRLDTRWLCSLSAQLQVGQNDSSAPAAPTWTTLAGSVLLNFSFR